MKIIAIDGMNFAYRYYYCLSHLKNSKDYNIGMLYGFLRFVQSLECKYKKSKIYILWDTKSQFRYDIYPEYKAHRVEKREEKTYIDIIDRVNDLKRILNCHNVIQLQARGYEADDIAKWLCNKYKNLEYEILLFSADKDWMQLIDDDEKIKISRQGYKGGYKIYDENMFLGENGFPVKGYSIFKCLKNDKSDNIKGIYRFPTKIAILLANRIINIEEFYLNKNCLDDIPDKWKLAILENKNLLRMNLKLITLYGTIDNVIEKVGIFNAPMLRKYYKEYEMYTLLDYIKKRVILKIIKGNKKFKIKI